MAKKPAKKASRGKKRAPAKKAPTKAKRAKKAPARKKAPTKAKRTGVPKPQKEETYILIQEPGDSRNISYKAYQKAPPHYRWRIIAVSLVAAILLILMPLIYYTDALTELSLEDVVLTDVSYSEGDFHFEGFIILNNPKMIPVGFNKVDYMITLDNGEIVLAKGTFPKQRVPATSELRLAFNQDVPASAPLESLLVLLEEERHHLVISGDMHVPGGHLEFQKSFEARAALEEYIMAQVQQFVDEASDDEITEYPSYLSHFLHE